jgi:hypothetical protein
VVDYAAEFDASFSRVTEPATRDQFLTRFYERFVAADALIVDKFRHTDMAHQKEMLRESLEVMRDFFLDHRSNPHLLTLARIHGGRGRDIPPRLYLTWLDCVVATVHDVDPEVTPNVELAWRIVMAPGIEFMKFYRDR